MESTRRSIDALISNDQWVELLYLLVDSHHQHKELVEEFLTSLNDPSELRKALNGEVKARLEELRRMISYGSLWDPLELLKVILTRSDLSVIQKFMDYCCAPDLVISSEIEIIDERIREIAGSKANRSAFVREYLSLAREYPERKPLRWHTEIEREISL